MSCRPAGLSVLALLGTLSLGMLHAQDDPPETVILRGVPFARVTGSLAMGEHEVLSEAASQEFRLIVSRQGERYFWASREQSEVIHTFAGAFHNFVRPGTGSVRVLDLGQIERLAEEAGLSSAASREALGGLGVPLEWDLEGVEFLYMEVLLNGLSSVTYFGIVEYADLRDLETVN